MIYSGFVPEKGMGLTMRQITVYVFAVIAFALMLFISNGSESADSRSITGHTYAGVTGGITTENIETSVQAATTTLLSAKYTEQDIFLIEKIVQSEVGDCSEASKIAVTNVILNRMKSDEFPDTITKIVFAKRQFSAAYNRSVVPGENTKEAVIKALNGEDNSQGALYFYAPKYVHNEKTIMWFESKQFLFELDGQRYFK